MSESAKDHLPESFYTMNAAYVTTTLTKKQLRETLLATNGRIFNKGYFYNLCTKHLGAGVYKVWLEQGANHD